MPQELAVAAVVDPIAVVVESTNRLSSIFALVDRCIGFSYQFLQEWMSQEQQNDDILETSSWRIELEADFEFLGILIFSDFFRIL